MAETIYVLCALFSMACAFMLLRSYSRARSGLSLWTGVCFLGLALNNALLVVDLVFLPTSIDLALWRSGVSLLSMLALIFGFVWEAR